MFSIPPVQCLEALAAENQELRSRLGVLDGKPAPVFITTAGKSARAGEAGAGFAVVADEVRSLAQRSAQAARETADRIDSSGGSAHRGLEASHRVKARLDDIVTRVAEMDQLAAEISRASMEQSSGLEQITSAVAEMDSVTQSNAAAAEETASAATQLSAQAAALHNAVAVLGQLIGTAATPVVAPPPAPAPARPSSPSNATRRRTAPPPAAPALSFK